MDDTYSQEVPLLSQKDLEHLKASAISIEVIKERGYRSISNKDDLEAAGFYDKQRRPGLLIPNFGVDGKPTYNTLRPYSPRVIKRKDKADRAIKYEHPKDTLLRLDVHPRSVKYLKDPHVPIFFVEGIKKADALISAGAECVVSLSGVWNWRGKNEQGGKTLLADFEYIALNDRDVYIGFDSDMWTNLNVGKAFKGFKGILEYKKSRIHALKLPDGPDGKKLGADDFLAEGHTLKDLFALETSENPMPEKRIRKDVKEFFTIDSGGYFFLKEDKHGSEELPLANFDARITDVITIDDGVNQESRFRIIGRLTATKEALPTIEVPTSNFDSLSWLTTKWMSKAFVYAGTTRNTKDLVLTNIKRDSTNAEHKTIFTHTGWREIDKEMVFLTAAGAIGKKDVQVELENKRLQRYRLEEPPGDVSEAIRTSLDYLDIGKHEITVPIWALMYLAPLCEILQPSFTLWLYGRSGSFKSVISALALCHFGDFDEDNVPGNFHDSQNLLEKLTHQAKDFVFLLDDFAPGQDPSLARLIEAKAEYIIRAQGNHQGRGRMKADTSSQVDYYPRGLILVTGEQDPSGHSFNSRIIAVKTDKDLIDVQLMTEAQKNRRQYSVAMAAYIMWLKAQWPKLTDEKEGLKYVFEQYRNKAALESQHARIPAAIAWLFMGFEMGLLFATEKGVLPETLYKQARDEGWKIICSWGAEQNLKTEEERPGNQFVKGLKAVISSGRARLANKEDESPQVPIPGTADIGWRDEGYILLNPDVAFGVVRDFLSHIGISFTWKERAVWDDMKRLGYTESDEGRSSTTAKIYGKTWRVIKVKVSVIDDF